MVESICADEDAPRGRKSIKTPCQRNNVQVEVYSESSPLILTPMQRRSAIIKTEL
jgi:hypothetical protein